MADPNEPSVETPDETIRRLRQDLQAREEFLSIAAHELRNPLTPISMQVAMLLRSARVASPPLPADIMKGLERLDLATRRFLNRATVLLDVSRLAAGHAFRPDVSRFDLSALVLDFIADRALIAERLRVSLDASAVEPGIAGAWDRVGIELILDNLISNAMKYGAGTPVVVGLQRRTMQQAGIEPQVRFWVRDGGPGIAMEDHERIFARFQQAHARKPTAGGFGVGLWVAREVARGMGGDINLDSRSGTGATFCVVLPQDVEANLVAAGEAK